MPPIQGQYKGGPQSKMFVYYTGKNINATAGSRTAYNADLIAGDVLTIDPYAHDTSDHGAEYAVPTSGHLHLHKAVVVNVPRGSERGGWVEVSPSFNSGSLNVSASCSILDVLAVQDASPKLIPATVFAATNMATFKTYGARCAIAHEAAGGAATIRGAFGIDNTNA